VTIERIPVTDRATWLALRMRDLTASDIAAVAGADPGRTALKVYAEKAGIIAQPDDSTIMRRGRWLEAAVIEALRDERPTWEIRRASVYLRDPAIRMGATPDAVAIDPARPGVGNVQCKVVSRPIFEADWDSDGETVRAPLNFQVQTLSESMLIDATWSVIAALVIDTYSAELVIAEVARHEGAERRIRETVTKFWSDFELGRQPPPVYARDLDVIQAMHPTSVAGTKVDLTGDNRLPELLARRARRKAYLKAAGEWVEAADAEIKHKLGDAEEGLIPGWKITNKSQSRKEVVLPPTSFRVLRITDKRAKERTAA
jgi:predicted phage-related endonuclease